MFHRMYSDYLFVHHGGESNVKFHQAAIDSIAETQDCMAVRSMRSCLYDPDLNLNMPVRGFHLINAITKKEEDFEALA